MLRHLRGIQRRSTAASADCDVSEAWRKALLVCGIASSLLYGTMMLTFWEAPRVQANLPTPWIGLWERINISVFLLWVVVLATVLLRGGGTGRSGPPGAMRWTT